VQTCGNVKYLADNLSQSHEATKKRSAVF